MTHIEEFNKKLVESNESINILEYAKTINTLTNKIDISFLEEFIGLIDKDEFSINAIKIYDLGIFSNLENKGILNKKGGFNSARFNKDIIKDKYKENIDYILVEISTSIERVQKH